MTLLKVDIFMKKWFFSNDPTHDVRANQTHINSDLAVIALLIYSHLLRYPVEVHPEGYVYHPSEYGKQGYRCDDVKHT